MNLSAADRDRIAGAGLLCEYWLCCAANDDAVGKADSAAICREHAARESAIAFKGYWA